MTLQVAILATVALFLCTGVCFGERVSYELATSSPFAVPVTFFLANEASVTDPMEIAEGARDELVAASSTKSEEEEKEEERESKPASSMKSMERNEYSNPYPVFHLLTPGPEPPQDMTSEIGQKEERIDLIKSQSSQPLPNLSTLFYSSSPQQEQYKSVVICDKTLAILEFTSVLLKCDLFDLEKNPEVAFAEVRKTGLEVKSISFQEMRRVINNCKALDEVDLPRVGNSSSNIQGQSNNKVTATATATATSSALTSDLFSSDLSSGFMSSWRALLPGTKWCGSGDSARSYSDLGKRRELDICCRAHDHCPVRLKALRSGYGLINFSLYTKSHCDCDDDFKRCLKSLNSKSADALANFFFNILRVQCIREEAINHCTGDK